MYYNAPLELSNATEKREKTTCPTINIPTVNPEEKIDLQVPWRSDMVRLTLLLGQKILLKAQHHLLSNLNFCASSLCIIFEEIYRINFLVESLSVWLSVCIQETSKRLNRSGQIFFVGPRVTPWKVYGIEFSKFASSKFYSWTFWKSPKEIKFLSQTQIFLSLHLGNPM